MTATLVGELNAAGLCPEVAIGVGFAGAQLGANLTASLAIQASVSVTPPTLAVQLAATLKAVTALEAGIAIGLPGVSFNASVAAALVAKAESALGNLAILIGLLGGPGFFVYEFAGGTVTNLGADIGSAIAGNPPPGLSLSSPVSGIMIGAAPTPWLAIKPFFGGVP